MSRQRGYTLVELLISTTIALTIVGVAIGVFLSQQMVFANIDMATSGQTALRDAQLEMEPALRRLGLGIEPRYALDFNVYSCTLANCRDKVAGPDEIVFYSRNPNYQWNDLNVNGCATAGGCFVGNAWPISSSTLTTVSVTVQPGAQFMKGQVIQAVCTGGSLSTFATVATTTPAQPATAAGTVAIPISAKLLGNPYTENNFASACFATPGAGLFLVDRFRYAVQDYAGTPYLVLDNGLDMNGNGRTPDEGDTDDLIPIAKGIEDIQFAYLYTPSGTLGFTAPDGNRNWIVGEVPGTVEQPNPAAATPVYATSSIDASRYNLNPANIRGVRFTLVARSLTTDRSQPKAWLGDPLPLTENRNTQLTALGRYRRYSTSTSIGLRNMDARSMTLF